MPAGAGQPFCLTLVLKYGTRTLHFFQIGDKILWDKLGKMQTIPSSGKSVYCKLQIFMFSTYLNLVPGIIASSNLRLRECPQNQNAIVKTSILGSHQIHSDIAWLSASSKECDEMSDFKLIWTVRGCNGSIIIRCERGSNWVNNRLSRNLNSRTRSIAHSNAAQSN